MILSLRHRVLFVVCLVIYFTIIDLYLPKKSVDDYRSRSQSV